MIVLGGAFIIVVFGPTLPAPALLSLLFRI